MINDRLQKYLTKREADNATRRLKPESNLIDFCSNDYLGFSRNKELRKIIFEAAEKMPFHINGSTGSRLISGNTTFTEEVEKRLAIFHNAETALLFNSGYDANIGLLSSVPKRNDVIFFDELVHASIHDGIRMNHLAKSFPFKHNDVEDLKSKVKLSSGEVFVVVESVYSMDGDLSPLKEFALLCEKNNWNLIVDEAHATGVIGETGGGLVQQEKLEKKIFARVHTFGKAMGCHGAVVLGNNLLHDYLINFSRSFIYTTALPAHAIVAIDEAHKYLASNNSLIDELKRKIALFKKSVNKKVNEKIIAFDSAIISLLYPGNENVKQLAKFIQDAGFDVKPILHPTVPSGAERLRICLHTYNTNEELLKLVELLNKHIQ
jgi:8-amino-7-oxononanoate synthase